MNNEAEHPGALDSLRMKDSAQAHSLSKHVEKLERVLDMVAPKSDTRHARRQHERARPSAASRAREPYPLAHAAKYP